MLMGLEIEGVGMEPVSFTVDGEEEEAAFKVGDDWRFDDAVPGGDCCWLTTSANGAVTLKIKTNEAKILEPGHYKFWISKYYYTVR